MVRSMVVLAVVTCRVLYFVRVSLPVATRKFSEMAMFCFFVGMLARFLRLNALSLESLFELGLSARPDGNQLNTVQPFNGKLYAKEDPVHCETVARSSTVTLAGDALQGKSSAQNTCGIKADVNVHFCVSRCPPLNCLPGRSAVDVDSIEDNELGAANERVSLLKEEESVVDLAGNATDSPHATDKTLSRVDDQIDALASNARTKLLNKNEENNRHHEPAAAPQTAASITGLIARILSPVPAKPDDEQLLQSS
ncbi:hypothetical protein L1887_60977 [Cichorium endivia]|nr:hypothetical protein L1887_60977 [Cichorium endivia]